MRGAHILRYCAAELEEDLREHRNKKLTIQQAVEESGYSADHLRALVASGAIPQAGRRGSPRIRRSDLPTKGARR